MHRKLTTRVTATMTTTTMRSSQVFMGNTGEVCISPSLRTYYILYLHNTHTDTNKRHVRECRVQKDDTNGTGMGESVVLSPRMSRLLQLIIGDAKETRHAWKERSIWWKLWWICVCVIFLTFSILFFWLFLFYFFVCVYFEFKIWSLSCFVAILIFNNNFSIGALWYLTYLFGIKKESISDIYSASVADTEGDIDLLLT